MIKNFNCCVELRRGNKLVKLILKVSVVLTSILILFSFRHLTGNKQSKGNVNRSFRKLVNVVKETRWWTEQHNQTTAKEGGVKNEIEKSVDYFRCVGCFKHEFDFLLNTEVICKESGGRQSVNLLLLIFTAHENTAARNALRRTWLNYTRNNTSNVRYVFLLGSVGNDALAKTVDEENKLYNDIVKEDFRDSYKNLTYKTVMGFKWALKYCSSAKAVVKTDDDMFINIPNLLRTVEQHTNELNNTILGSCSEGQLPIRDKNSKWQASELSYPGLRYPAFCSGTCYVTSLQMVRKLYKMSADVPFFHLEDVYVGLCLHKLQGRVKPIPGFHTYPQKLDPCIFKGDTLITSHSAAPGSLMDVWNKECK